MAEPYVVCPKCDKRLRNVRRYPIKDLAKFFRWNLTEVGRHLKISGSTFKQIR